jgi:hypothetical protein
MAMTQLKIDQQIIRQMQIVEAAMIEFNKAKKLAIDAKKELERLKKLRQTNAN